jgi:hypothetical protein
MSIPALLLAAAAPAQAPAERVLDCRLTTASGDEVAFSARLGMPAAVLQPVAGAAWPARRVIGPGSWRERKGIEARYFFAGSKNNVELLVNGERATLFVDKRMRPQAPRATGFCLPAADASAVRADLPVSPAAGADVPAFDSARWPASDCGLVTRSGRHHVVGYSILGAGTQSEIKAADDALLGSRRAVVPRVQGFGKTVSRFGGKDGPAGTERLVVDEKSAEAVQLIEFDRIGTPGSAEPAAAICGRSGIVKRAVRQ